MDAIQYCIKHRRLCFALLIHWSLKNKKNLLTLFYLVPGDHDRDVERLRTSVEKTLTDRQEFLNQRGERIHCQARQLQEEASTLHSKTCENMLRAVQHE